MSNREKFCKAFCCQAIGDEVWEVIENKWDELGDTEEFWEDFFCDFPEFLNTRSEYSGYSEACGYWN